MPKTVEYYPNGVREISHKKACHSCWDCSHCVDMIDVTHYLCTARRLSSKRNVNFPYDNTKCKEFKARDDKT